MSNEIDVKWSGAEEVDGENIRVGTCGDRWFATHEKPYFCFEGADRSEVIDLSLRALIWYRSVKR